MNIYDQVEKLLNQNDEKPDWVCEILFELREIKKLLQKTNTPYQKTKKDDKYFAFVNKLREKLRADIINEKYPEIYYNNKTLGINFKGWIYDKSTTKELPAQEAFEVYRFLYENRDNLDKYLKI